MRIPVTSLWQPWASLMALGRKRNETRGYEIPRTLLNTPVGIHAAVRKPTLDEIAWFTGSEYFRQALTPDVATSLPTWQRYCMVKALKALPYGSIVAVGMFRASVPAMKLPREGRGNGGYDNQHPILTPEEEAFGLYDHGRFAWVTSKVVALAQPIPAKGKQGVWYFDVPGEVLRGL